MDQRKPTPTTPATIHINGKPYHLRFPLRVLQELEEVHQISILRGGNSVTETLRDPVRLAVLLQAALKTAHPDITLDWVADNVEASMLLEFAPELVYAATGRKPDIEAAIRAAGGISPNVEGQGSPGLTSGQLDGTTLAFQKTNSGI